MENLVLGLFVKNVHLLIIRITEKVQHRPEHTVAKQILQFDKQGIFIREWKSTKEASIYYKTVPESISNNLTGKSKSSNNFIWKFKEIK
jgi:hypothetical protein